MRSDMAKKLTEKARAGRGYGEDASRHARRTIKHELSIDSDDVDMDVHQGIKAHVKKSPKLNLKDHNENINPIRRYLLSQVGNKWDNIYSDIMNNLNLNNQVQYRLYQRLMEYGIIDTKAYMDGKTVMASGFCGPHSVGYYSWRPEFYVHPLDGTLQFTKQKSNICRYSEKRKEYLNKFRYIDFKNPLVQYHSIKGVWYEFTFRKATIDEEENKSFGEIVKDYSPISCPQIPDRFMFGAVAVAKGNKSKPDVYCFDKISDNTFVNQLMPSFEPSQSYYHDALWNACQELFCGHYLPLSKKQVNSKIVKKIEAMIAARDSMKKVV